MSDLLTAPRGELIKLICEEPQAEPVVSSHDFLMLKGFFKVGYYTTYAAFIGVLTAKVLCPPMINILLLRMLSFIDVILIKLGILRGTVYFIVGEKKK